MVVELLEFKNHAILGSLFAQLEKYTRTIIIAVGSIKS